MGSTQLGARRGERGVLGDADSKHGTAAFLAIDLDEPTVVIDDAFDDGETDAGAVGAGGEEGIEEVAHRLGRDTGAGIDDFEHPTAGCRFSHTDRDIGARGGGLDGVSDEVPQELTELGVVSLDDGTRLGAEIGDVDIFGAAAGAFSEEDDIASDATEVCLGDVGGFGSSEVEHIADEVIETGGFTLNDVAKVSVIGTQAGGVAEQFDRGGDGAQGVSDFVSETRGDLAEIGEPFGALGALGGFLELTAGQAESLGQVAGEEGDDDDDEQVEGNGSDDGFDGDCVGHVELVGRYGEPTGDHECAEGSVEAESC